MSRSYKHNPYCHMRSSKTRKEIRKHYNHSLRQKLKKDIDFIIQNNDYKKVIPDTWDVFCRNGYWTLKDAIQMEKDAIAIGQPIYNRRENRLSYEYNEQDIIHSWKKWFYYK